MTTYQTIEIATKGDDNGSDLITTEDTFVVIVFKGSVKIVEQGSTDSDGVLGVVGDQPNDENRGSKYYTVGIGFPFRIVATEDDTVCGVAI